MKQNGLCLRCKKMFTRESNIDNHIFFFDCNQHKKE